MKVLARVARSKTGRFGIGSIGSVWLLALTASGQAVQEFTAHFDGTDRTWIGAEMWANRLQDWRVANSRLECVAQGEKRLAQRNVHLLTHRVGAKTEAFTLSARVGYQDDDGVVSPESFSGFLIGAGADMDYRASAIIHCWPGASAGTLCGVFADGRVFIRDNTRPDAQAKLANAAARPLDANGVALSLSATRMGDELELLLRSRDPETLEVLSEVRLVVDSDRARGGTALVSHPGIAKEGITAGRYWFDDWSVKGTNLDVDPSRTFGPIAGTQYTLSRGVLKLTAQMLPIADAQREVSLEVKENERWREVARSTVELPSYTAHFRVENWDEKQAHRYRVVHQLAEASGWRSPATWEGTIRKDPVDKRTIRVAGFTGNHNNSHGIGAGWGNTGANVNNWREGMWFPHGDLTANVAKHRPDLLFFSGDQVYEGKSPTFADRKNIELDYLYKWLLWVWAWRDLTKDIPAVTIPDDHDVYQGNIWGEGGRKTKRDHFGGYVHPASFVKMVERTQTSHLPDPFDPRPVDQDIGVYFTDLVWGRISFAVLEDRKFKSGCAREELPPTGTKRPDHVTDPAIDLSTFDLPGLSLLGERQLDFVDHWAGDWRGADMKVVLSQTAFAGLATHHGANLQYLLADLDSNAWPQTGRRRALESLRRGFAFHLCGDQHLATMVHHGVDAHRDSIWSFCVPSVANFYPRMWMPPVAGENREEGAPDWTGDHFDGLGNRVTVYAATNPGEPSGHEPADLHDKMAGFGLIELDKLERTIHAECWPRYADASRGDEPYPGWPMTIRQMDNYARAPEAWLPVVVARGVEQPIIRVHDADGLVYAIRATGSSFHPHVFDAEGTYTVEVSRDGEDWKREAGITAGPRDDVRLLVFEIE